MIGNATYDRYISMGSWINAILYAGPALVLVIAFNYLEISNPYLIPVLLVYLIGALAHMIGYGFQGVNAQIKVSVDYAVGEIRMNNK